MLLDLSLVGPPRPCPSWALFREGGSEGGVTLGQLVPPEAPMLPQGYRRGGLPALMALHWLA